MNFTYKKFTKLVCRCLIIGFGLMILPANSAAETNILNHFSFDDCDPFEARALIMAVHAKKTQFVAAEQTIYVVDANLGDDGHHMDFGSFRPGQWVYVKGFKHIDGGVVASLVQKIDTPEQIMPVLRKIIKKPRRHKRTHRLAAPVRE
jgi:hypothetical protein